MRAELIGQRSAHPLLGPAVASIVVGIDQLAKTAAPHLQSALVAPARNPDYAFGAVGGSALALILGSVTVLAVFLAVIGRLASRVGVSPALPALIAGGMLGNTLVVQSRHLRINLHWDDLRHGVRVAPDRARSTPRAGARSPWPRVDHDDRALRQPEARETFKQPPHDSRAEHGSTQRRVRSRHCHTVKFRQEFDRPIRFGT